jgi:ubiquinone/menaquinone biosynthesis C-methylase UbiE
MLKGVPQDRGGAWIIPWPDNTFDIVTAFETVYFWPDFVNGLNEVGRMLKPGLLFIRNEMNKPKADEAPVNTGSKHRT